MGLYQVSRYIGAALGTAVAATSLLGFGRLSDPTRGSYRWTALVGAGIALAAALVAWVLSPRADAAAVDSSARFQIVEGEVATGLEDMVEVAPLVEPVVER